MAGLKLENVNKVYPNGAQAVYDFNLDIKDGEFIVFVGPSGCGKTTTLRMIAGLEDITSGKLFIDSKNMTEAAPKNRDISMVFQNYALYGHMTVYKNMAFSLALRGEAPDVIHEKVLETAKILGLMTQLNKLPKHLSGGQRQRVAVGRAIVRNPKVFLFDEPLSNLDAKLRGEMRREIKLLHQKLNTTMIYVTHDQTEALTLADRIVCMSMGRVQQVGTPLELYSKPANIFVASFIGLPPMNFFEAEVTSDCTLKTHDFTVALSKEYSEKLKGYSGKTVVLGIRPEDAVLNGDVAVTVKIGENLGQHTLIHSSLNGKKVIFKLSGWLDCQAGQQLKIGFMPDKIHIFDKQTTNAIV